MRNLTRHILLILGVLLLAAWAVFPPSKKLKGAKDIAGGSTLVYEVFIRPSDPSDTLARVRDLIAQRLDPKGLADISITAQGNNRLEITMPLPTEAVGQLRRAFEDSVSKIGETQLSATELERRLGLPAAERDAEFARMASGDAARLEALRRAGTAHDLMAAERAKFAAVEAPIRAQVVAKQALIDEAVRTNADPNTKPQDRKDPALIESLRAEVKKLTNELIDKGVEAARADIALDVAKRDVLAATLTAPEVRAVLEKDSTDRRFPGADGKPTVIPSPRSTAINRLKTTHSGSAAQIDTILAAWGAYQAERKTLDDPSDVKRLLRSAGVLEFRIAPKLNEVTGESDLRKQLLDSGPRSARGEAKWYKINKLDGWFRRAEDYDTYAKTGARSFFGNMGYVVEEYDGEPYMLCYDVPGLRLTQAEGNWQVASARQTVDQLGRPAIGFEMDVLGAQKMGELTGANTGRSMAVLLDDQVYTAPNLNSRISTNGIIEGQFQQAEIDYVVRVLGAGSMAARISPEPVSESTVGPELGADNLQRGLKAGVIAFALVAAFMIVYYFGCGMVSVVALLMNAVLILGLMAFNHAAFSLPGIAGIVLTFGMAVDANVLIYERMREEMERGADFRSAVRLGYSRAMSSIVDGNITVFIVVVVLAFLGTQEIKGFAITMIIGSLTTFFTQLYATRVIFTWLVERMGWRHGSMLTLKMPALARALTPNIDWMKYRYVMLGISAIATIGGLFVILGRGADLFDNDFRGGTKVTVQLRDAAPGTPAYMPRLEAEKRIEEAGLKGARVVTLNPDPNDRLRASRFAIKTTSEDAAMVQERVLKAFGDVIDTKPPVAFDGSASADAGGRVVPITLPMLSENNIKGPRKAIPEFVGGAAVLIENMNPRPTLEHLAERLRLLRNDPQHVKSFGRAHEWVILSGDEKAVQSAALLVRDESINFLQDQQTWSGVLKTQEWKMVTDALSRSTSLAGVESFSASIASSFAAQAIVSIILSSVFIVIYIWLRFQSFRYSIGAILSTIHDCIVATAAIALCERIVGWNPGLADAIGIGPFKIDLNVVAAILTILGYSLNDTVIVMDRIRETKGKLPFATRQIINDSINQTISRTVITSGLTLLATLTLYLFGGEAIRPFAFTFLIGVITGTYSSVFIAAPIVWVHKEDPTYIPRAERKAVAGA